MSRRRVRAAAAALCLLAAGGVATAGPAAAAHVTCGQTIVADTVLDGNVGPCTTGITIGADNVTFDLRGFTVTGTPAAGDGAGISLFGRTGVTVKNGTVTQFDAGVLLVSGSRNTVTGVRALQNRGTSELGDGVLLYRSHFNAVTNSQFRDNGPYDGIGLLGSEDNRIDSNQVADNRQAPALTSGILLATLGAAPSARNSVTNNQVANNAVNGIHVHPLGRDNVVRANQVVGNGQDGIRLGPETANNTVEANTVRSNGGIGVHVRGAADGAGPATNNRILRNISFANAVLDLLDGSPNCGTNFWSGNQAATFAPPCTMNP